MNSYFQRFQKKVIPLRMRIIRGFQLTEALIFALIAYGSWRLYVGDISSLLWYDIGSKMGVIATITFSISLLPGIFRRFGILQPLSQLLMLFRRHIGILTYVLSLGHYMLVRFVLMARQGSLGTVVPPTFEILGFWALNGMLLMALTSNDWSVRRLGVWWGRLHKITYGVAWLVFGHVALQQKPIMVLIGTLAVLEIVSYIYKYTRKPKAIVA